MVAPVLCGRVAVVVMAARCAGPRRRDLRETEECGPVRGATGMALSTVLFLVEEAPNGRTGTGRNGLREYPSGVGPPGFERPGSPQPATRQGPVSPGQWACDPMRPAPRRVPRRGITWACGSLPALDVSILPAPVPWLSSPAGGGRCRISVGAASPFGVTSTLTNG